MYGTFPLGYDKIFAVWELHINCSNNECHPYTVKYQNKDTNTRILKFLEALKAKPRLFDCVYSCSFCLVLNKVSRRSEKNLD